MKKVKKILLIIIPLAILLAVFCVLRKPEKSVSDFDNFMSSRGLTCADTSNIVSDGEMVTDAMIAVTDNYQIEFYKSNSKDNAKQLFQTNVNSLNELMPNGKSKTRYFFGYKSFEIEDSKYYAKVIRVGQTYVYTRVPISAKDDVKELLKEFNY